MKKEIKDFNQWFLNECEYIGYVGQIKLYVIKNKIDTYSYEQLFEYYKTNNL
jgi:hypothetical protein